MKVILFVLSVVFCNVVMAQKKEISELNRLFAGEYNFVWVKKGIEINFLKLNETFRKEFFRSFEIEWEKTKFNEADQMIVISCKENYPDCIDRKIIRTKSRRQLSKTTFKTNGSDQANTAIELLKRLSAD